MIFGGFWIQVFNFANGYPNDAIYLGRYGYNTSKFVMSLREGTSACQVLSSSNTLYQDRWYTVVARWRAFDELLELNIDGVKTTSTCTNNLADRMSTNNYIGAERSSLGRPMFNGHIAGLYVFDRYLSDIEVAAVSRGIVINLDVLFRWQNVQKSKNNAFQDWPVDINRTDRRGIDALVLHN